MTKTILIIEDESSIADTISYALKTESFGVEWKTLGAEGVACLQRQAVDLVILDVGLPDMSGFEVCKQIRAFSPVPIIFLTARAEEVDRIVGLEIGADDYVAKPFSPRELVARVKAILKRVGGADGAAHPAFRVDKAKGRIVYQGQTLDLTRYEYRLLSLFLSQPGRIFSRGQLMEQVWDAPEAALDRTVDAHIKMLRARLRDIGAPASLIKTHRGMGYSFEE